jgi:glycosyltransferase involved in cell wall biosynthesis
LGIETSDIVLLYIGSISARKGILSLINTFALSAANNSHIRLMLVGPIIEHEYGESVFAAIKDKSLVDRITHVPYVENVRPYYLISDIFVFASYSEGFGNVLLEAMSFGLPVISRYINDVTDTFIEHGLSGYLFSDDESFKAALEALIAEPSQRRDMGERGRQRVHDSFLITDIARRYVSLYRSIVRLNSLPLT